MLLAYACFTLFFFVFFLVLAVHLLVWNYGFGESVSGFRVWVAPFECGFLSQRLVENYFSYTYFVLLVFFVVFDLEISLLLNMPLQGILFKNLVFYFFFLCLLGFGFLLEVDKGYVRWSY
nr:NADH dehydrogenase subunit 3 [Glypthelmins quieta]